MATMKPVVPSTDVPTTGSTVLNSGIWATASRLLPQFSTLLVSVVAARSLGPDGMGRQSFIAFAAIFGTTAVTLGLPTALTRYIGETVGARRPETLRPLVGTVWRIETVAALVGGGVLVAIGLSGAEPRAAWILTGCVCAFSVLQRVATAVLIGLQHWREASVVSLVTGTLGTAATIAVLALGGGITGMIAVGAAATFLALVSTARLAYRRLALFPAPRRDPGLHTRTWRYALISSIGVPVTLVVWFRSELFFLGHYASDEQIALYSIAFSAYTALVILPQTVATVLAPSFATLYGAGGSERIRAVFGRATRLLVTATLALTAAAAVLGPEVLRLAYGSEYHGTVRVFLILLVVLPLVPLFQVSTSLLFGVGRQWAQLFIGAAAAVVDLAVASVLIPTHAAVGAALANAAGQLALSVPVIVYAVHVVGNISWEPRALMQAALAAASSGTAGLLAANWLGGVSGLAVGAVVIVVVFALVARVAPVLSPADGLWLEQTVHRRVTPIVRWICRPARGEVTS